MTLLHRAPPAVPDKDGGSGGEVVLFPRASVETPVLDAELVPTDAPPPLRPVRAVATRVVTTARVVATHEHTKTASRLALRNALYVPLGAAVVVRRVWEAQTNSRYERILRAAEVSNDWDRLAEWEARAEQARERRHRRRMDLLEAPAKLAKAGAIATVAATVMLGLVGLVLFAATGDANRFLVPFVATMNLIKWGVYVVALVWGPLVLALPWLLVLTLWWLGRKVGATPPVWLQPAAHRVACDDPITPSKVVTALRDLGISYLRNTIREMGDAGAGMLGPIRIAGCGVEVDVTLPSGVSTNEIQKRRRKLAENLDRHEHEVFVTIPAAARTVRLWIADSGALDEPIGPSPLVIDPDMTADYYTGAAPWGQSLRGDLAALSLSQRHVLITGLSNQGKTAAMRALALWLALDTSTELRIADLKGIGDWHMFDGLATVLTEGPSDEHCVAATHMLEDGVDEMRRRLSALDPDKYPNGVTRDLARSNQGFHPLILVVDEAQNAFMCPIKDDAGAPYGGKANTSRYFMAARKLHNQGRAVNVVLWQGTQDPTDQNLPKLVREGAHVRASLVVGTEEQARMALGDKAINGGAAPHKLRQGLDKGTLEVAGDGVSLPAGAASITIRTHFVDGEAAGEIAERAKRLRGNKRSTLKAVPDEERDLLADTAAALGGEERVKTVDVAARLRKLAPHYRPYAALDGTRLSELLEGLGVRVTRKDGYPQVRTERVHEAMAERVSGE